MLNRIELHQKTFLVQLYLIEQYAYFVSDILHFSN